MSSNSKYKNSNQTIFDVISIHKFLISFVVILSIILTLLYIKWVPKVYQSRSTISIEAKNSNEKSYENFIQTQLDYLQSQNLLLKVKKLDNESLRRYQKNLGVKRNGDRSSFITLSFDANDPIEAKEFLEDLIDKYFSLKKKDKNNNYIKFKKILDSELDKKKRELDEVEEQIVEYASQNSAVGLKSQTNKLIDTISKNQERLSKIDTKLQTIKTILKTIRKNKDYKTALTLFSELDNKNLPIIVNQIIEDEKKYLEYKKKYKDLHPEIVKIKNSMAQNERALKINLVELYKTLKRQKQYLYEEMQSQKNMLYDFPKKEVDLGRLNIKHAQLEKEYTVLLEKKANFELQNKIKQDYVFKVIDKPSTPKRYIKPRSIIVLLLGTIFGFIVGLIMSLLKEYFRNKIVNINDIYQLSSKQVLEVIPKIKDRDTKNSLFVIKKPNMTASQKIWFLRNTIERYKDDDALILAITSSKYHEGKNLLASNLAATLGNGDKKVLLISFDIRYPKIHRKFAISNRVGLSSVLFKKENINKVIKKVKGYLNLYFIPAGRAIQTPANITNSKYIPVMIDELKKVYDYIILDLPPIFEAPETLYIMHFANLNIISLKANFSTKDSIKDIEELTSRDGIENIAYVLTNAKS